MPLLAYFATIGALLTALVLLLDVMLAPDKPAPSRHPVAGVETGVRQPRTTSGLAPPPAVIAPSAPIAESRDRPPQTTTMHSVTPTQVQPSMSDGATSPAGAKPKSKTRQGRTKDRSIDAVGRPFSDGSAYGYAREKPAPHYSPEGTLGPH